MASAALALGAAAMASPAFAMLGLALLGANALAKATPASPLGLAGPCLAALIVTAFAGVDGGVGTLFVWRVVADARWSIEEAKRLARNAGRLQESASRKLLHAWTTPALGVAVVAYTAPHMVAGLPLDLPHVPIWAPLALAAIALLLVGDWALQCAADWRLGELAPAPAAHLLCHHLVFGLAYSATADLSAGIVAMLAWRLLHAAPLPLPRRAQPSFTAVP